MVKEGLVGAAVALALAVSPAAAFAAPPKTDLTILVDGSGSIDASDWDLQRQGFATALSDVASVPLDGSIAIGVVQWASDTTVEFPLTQIDDQADLDAAKNALLGMVQKQASTASGEGVYAGTAASVAGRRPGATPVHCMSTDGTLNEGRSLDGAVADAKAKGIERYSVIGIDDFGNTAALRSFYGQYVYGGGAVTIARNTAEFATLIGGSCLSPAVRLRAMEVNQGIQDWSNSQPVVRDRKTVVRAFVDVPPGTPATRVTGRLIGRRGGSELPGSPLPAVNLGSAILAREDIVPRRDVLADSLNFVLPSGWTNGDVELEFEAGGAPVDCKEPANGGSSSDDCIVSATFGDARNLGVTFWSVMIDGSGPHTGLLAEQIARTQSALPISNLTTTMRGLNYPAGSTPDLERINDDLLRFKEIDRTSCTGLCSPGARDVYYGVVDGGADTGGLANGIPGQTASGHIGGVSGRDDTGYARNRAPHEIAHTLGVHHAVDNSKGIRDRQFDLLRRGAEGRPVRRGRVEQRAGPHAVRRLRRREAARPRLADRGRRRRGMGPGLALRVRRRQRPRRHRPARDVGAHGLLQGRRGPGALDVGVRMGPRAERHHEPLRAGSGTHDPRGGAARHAARRQHGPACQRRDRRSDGRRDVQAGRRAALRGRRGAGLRPVRRAA